MAKKKQELKIKHKVTVVIYHPEEGVEESKRPQFIFEGELMRTKTTEYIFSHMRKALRMEKLKLAKEMKEDDRTNDPST